MSPYLKNSCPKPDPCLPRLWLKQTIQPAEFSSGPVESSREQRAKGRPEQSLAGKQGGDVSVNSPAHVARVLGILYTIMLGSLEVSASFYDATVEDGENPPYLY